MKCARVNPLLPLVIGHRGAKKVAPENTLASIKQAAKSGATWVEVDVQLSSDSIPILIHDSTVDRTTDGLGEIKALDLTSIKLLDAGGWFSSKFSGETIPTLQEALKICNQLKLGINIEIKPGSAPSGKIVKTIISVLHTFGDDFCGRLLFSSFDAEIIEMLQATAPQWPRGLLVESIYDNLKNDLDRLECFSIHPAISCLETTQHIKGALKFGLPIVPYTVNDFLTGQRLIKHGIHSFITDDPEIFPVNTHISF